MLSSPNQQKHLNHLLFQLYQYKYPFSRVATPKIQAVENIDNVDDAIYPSHQNLVMTTFYILIYYLKIVTFRKT